MKDAWGGGMQKVWMYEKRDQLLRRGDALSISGVKVLIR
jgi:hypothetical protein